MSLFKSDNQTPYKASTVGKDGFAITYFQRLPPPEKIPQIIQEMEGPRKEE
jgi:hypothetical protein